MSIYNFVVLVYACNVHVAYKQNMSLHCSLAFGIICHNGVRSQMEFVLWGVMSRTVVGSCRNTIRLDISVFSRKWQM